MFDGFAKEQPCLWDGGRSFVRCTYVCWPFLLHRARPADRRQWRRRGESSRTSSLPPSPLGLLTYPYFHSRFWISPFCASYHLTRSLEVAGSSVGEMYGVSPAWGALCTRWSTSRRSADHGAAGVQVHPELIRRTLVTTVRKSDGRVRSFRPRSLRWLLVVETKDHPGAWTPLAACAESTLD